MFENELKTIFNKYCESIKLIYNLKKVYKEYDWSGTKRDNIFYLNIRIPYISDAKNKLEEELKNIFLKRGLLFQKEKSIKNFVKEIKQCNIDKFFDDMTYYIPYNERKQFVFKTNSFKISNVYYNSLYLILNAIHLLNNTDVLTNDIAHKLYKLANSGQTFVFEDCKVTHFKNQNLCIEFANNTTFEQFKNKFNEALKRAYVKKRKEN